METAGQLLDMGDYPRIDAAGVAEAYMLPDGRARFLLFDWYRYDGVWRRQVTGQVTRSIATLKEEQRRFWLQAAQTPLTSAAAFVLQ